MPDESPGKQRFQQAYASRAPWDIGRPQPAFVLAADRIDGSILDVGCGTGENARSSSPLEATTSPASTFLNSRLRKQRERPGNET